MDHIGPLIQTVLWVALVGGIIWRFNKPIDGILSALQRRIESGSNVKAGWFELTDRLRPQDPLSQQEKAAQEIQELLQTEQPPAPVAPLEANAPSRTIASLQAKYFQAEDLVLRAIQAEYGATISRQVTAGRDMGFDGAFVTHGCLNIVEVKYMRSPSGLSRLRETLDRLAGAVARYGWKNVKIVLALVFEQTQDLSYAVKKLEGITSGMSIPVVIRTYDFADLQRRFGVLGDGGEAG